MSRQEVFVRRRLELTAGLMALGFSLLVIRAIDLHWLQGDELLAKAQQQQYRQYAVNAPRGPILDRNHRVLSESIEVPSIGAVADALTDTNIRDIASALAVEEGDIRKRLQKRRGFVWLARQVTPAQAEQVDALNIKGVRIEKEWQRFYPLGPEMGHILGFVGVDNHGLEGIERTQDTKLQGQEGLRVVRRDARGDLLPGSQWLKKPQPGEALSLTIDANLQSLVYAELAKRVKESQAKGGSVVVMNPHNGDVLAMANWPGFNPNDFRNYRPGQWRNRAITDVFEPGSTMKPFTVATALESGKWKANSLIYCENGEYQVADYVIHDDHKEGWLTLKGIVERSSNIGAAKLALDVGAERIYQSLHSLGFGQKAGLHIGGESPGILLQSDKWGEVETANISFGQGVAVSALQLADAFAVLANGGYKVQPRLIQSDQPVSQPRQLMKSVTVHHVKDMLEAAVSDAGTGFRAVPEGYAVAGKTGTAQKAEKGSYSNERFTALFAGFAPAESPEIVVVVVIDEPQTSIYGGKVAAPVFRDIVASALPYLNVPPKQKGQREWQAYPVVLEEESRLDPGFVGLSLRESYRLAHRYGLRLKTHGQGWVERQQPIHIESLAHGEQVEVWLHE